jgi:hypothetical protein
MKSQRQFNLSLVLNEFPALASPAGDQIEKQGRERRVGERLDRLRRLGIESARQRAVQIEAMCADFERMATDLETDIRFEEDRTRVHEPAHFAYSTIARSMTRRRDNLRCSIGKLKRQLADVNIVLE